MKTISIVLFLFSCMQVKSQGLEEMQKQFSGKMAIFSSINRVLEISIKKNTPYAEATETTEMMILDETANGRFNREQVYHSSFNELKKVEAFTLVPDGKSMKKVKVTNFKTQSSRSSGVFYDDMKETTFDFPLMTKGSIAHMETQHFNKDIRFLTGFYFSNYLPVAHSSFSVSFPAEVSIKYIIRNDADKMIAVAETKKGGKKTITFSAKNIKDYEHYSDGTSIRYYAPHVIIYVSSYEVDKETVQVFSSLDALYKWNAGFLANINTQPDATLKKLADSITSGTKTDKEKVRAIYTWVQDHIKYVAFEEGLEGFVPRQAADVCRKRYGDCKDMASILTELCSLSAVKAHFTWIGTRAIPYAYSEVPLPVTDDHMICAVQLDGQWTFLDATDPQCIFGLPTSGIQGKEALISFGPDKYELVKVPIVPAETNLITDSTFLHINDGMLKGNSSVNYLGYFGSDVFRNLQYHTGEDERKYALQRMGKASNKFMLKDYKFTLSEKGDKAANISAHFEIPDYVKSIGDEIYLNLNLEKLVSSTPIDIDKRKVAVENEFLYTINQVHQLEIPAGYTTDYIPKNVSVSNDLFTFSIDYSHTGNNVTATQQFLCKKLYIQPQDFATWNKALATIAPAYKEQVVLRKK